MNDLRLSNLFEEIKKKGVLTDFVNTINEPKAMKRLSKKTSLADDDLKKYRQIINDPEALISIDDPLGINRNLCMLCKLDCKSYKPAHSYIFNNKLIFPSYCINCGCGASNHLQTEFEYKMLPKEIIKVLYNNNLTNENLNFDGILTVFSIENANGLEISNFLKLLKEAGFNIVGTKVNTILDNDIGILSENIEKYYNDLVKGKSQFSKLVIKDATIRTLNLNKRKDKKFVENSKTITVPRKKNNNVEYLDHFINPVLSICLQSKPKRGHSTIKYFEEIYFSTRRLFSTNINLIYYSKTKINALWDLQIMFPEIFKVNSYISIVTEKNNFFKQKKTNNSIKEIYEHNNFFLKTKTLKIERMNQNEEENKRKIDEIQAMKESKFKAEKIKSGYSFYSQDQNTKENLTKTLSPIPILTSNVFFKNTKDDDEENKPLEKDIGTPLTNLRQKNQMILNFDNNQDSISSSEDVSSFLSEQTPEKSEFINLKDKMKESDKIGKFEIENKTLKEREYLFFKNLSVFKDYISLNSCVINDELIFNSKSKILQLCKQFKENTFIRNFCNYILSTSLENKCKYTDIMLLSKVGPNIFVNSSNVLENIDVVNISKPKDFEIISNLFFEDIVCYSRALVVFRPLMVRCGLNEALINIFKINGFYILKRKFMKLSKVDAKFLFSMEGLDPDFLDDYIRIMIESEVEILCLSRYGAV